jgi:cupin 2 domain-containing protein
MTNAGPFEHVPPTGASHGRLLSGLPDGADGEEFLPLVANGATRIERIVSTGQASPPGFWYDQDDDEFVLLVAGRAVLAIAGQGEPLVLEPGDWANFPAHCRHRVEWTSAEPPTIWLAVFSPAAG